MLIYNIAYKTQYIHNTFHTTMASHYFEVNSSKTLQSTPSNKVSHILYLVTCPHIHFLQSWLLTNAK